MDSYNKLLNTLKQQKVDEDVLIKIRNKFRKEIDSPRRLMHVKCLTDLLELLERQLLLHFHNIGVIYKIVDECPINGIQELIVEHHKTLIDYNYFSNRIEWRDKNIDSEPTNSTHYIPKNVIDLVCERIGESWMELAYELKIKSGDIDFIDDKFNNSLEKAKVVFNHFITSEQSNKRGFLLNALSNIKRHRLKNEVENILLNTCIHCRRTQV